MKFITAVLLLALLSMAAAVRMNVAPTGNSITKKLKLKSAHVYAWPTLRSSRCTPSLPLSGGFLPCAARQTLAVHRGDVPPAMCSVRAACLAPSLAPDAGCDYCIC